MIRSRFVLFTVCSRFVPDSFCSRFVPVLFSFCSFVPNHRFEGLSTPYFCMARAISYAFGAYAPQKPSEARTRPTLVSVTLLPRKPTRPFSRFVPVLKCRFMPISAGYDLDSYQL